MKKSVWIVCVSMLIFFAATAFFPERGYTMQQDTDSPVVSLPKPVTDGSVSLEKALSSRRSTRSFSDASLSLREAGQLLWAAQGITGERGFRTAPSAGALYPLEIYVAAGNVENLSPGLYHYRPESHALRRISGKDHRPDIWEAALRQAPVKNAPAVFLFAGVFPRTMAKYGKRGTQYVFMESGHAAQNLLLQAEAMALGHVPIGAFNDEVMGEILKADENTRPLYILPVGRK